MGLLGPNHPTVACPFRGYLLNAHRTVWPPLLDIVPAHGVPTCLLRQYDLDTPVMMHSQCILIRLSTLYNYSTCMSAGWHTDMPPLPHLHANQWGQLHAYTDLPVVVVPAGQHTDMSVTYNTPWPH